MRQIEKYILDKVDSSLKHELSLRKNNSQIKVILTLEAQESNPLLERDAVDPKSFNSREEYRRALISQKQERVALELDDIKKDLSKLSVRFQGGKASNIIVAYGTVAQIEKALGLPGVLFGSLDHNISSGEQEKYDMYKRLWKAMAEIIKDYSLDSASKKPLEFQEEIDSNSRLYKSARSFVDDYEGKFGNLKVFGAPDARPLNSIYISADMDEVSEPQSPPASKHLWRTFKNRQFYRTNQSVSGKDFCKNHDHILVLGNAGSGKSVFLKKIALDALKADQKDSAYKIPVLIELRSFTTGEVDFAVEIQKIFRSYGVPSAETFTEFGLKNGRLMILLDGLDEIPEQNLPGMKDSINRFVNENSANKFVISCRLAAINEMGEIEAFKSFSKIQIADFSKDKIEIFIAKWFSSTEDADLKNAERCKKLLFKPENLNARDLARTPLFLTFLCLIYDHYGTFPDNRSFLYRQALNILLNEWSAGKQSVSQKVFRGLDIYLEEAFLSEIAYNSFSSGRLYFTRTELKEAISSFIDGNYNATQSLSCDFMFKEMITRQGILTEHRVIEKDPVYFFSHLTLQEYLAAKYINDCGLVEEIVNEHFGNLNWRSIFPLLSGLMLCKSGADKLILCMSSELHKFASTGKTEALVCWAYQRCITLSDFYEAFLVERTLLVENLLHYLLSQIKDKDERIYRNISYSIYLSHRWSYARTKPSSDMDIMKNIITILEIAKRLINHRATNDRTSISEIRKNLEKTQELVEDLNRKIRKERARHTQQAIEHVQRKSATPAPKKAVFSVLSSSELDKLAIMLENLISMVPSHEKDQKYFEIFIAHINTNLKNMLVDFLKIPEDLLSISEEESAEIEKYFYVNYLLDYCISAASRLSHDAVEQARKRMLAPANTP